MAQQTNPRDLSRPGEEGVPPDSQSQQLARPRPARPRRRRRRQAAASSRRDDEPRTFQVYRFSSRAPPVPAHCNGGSSQTPALPDDGNIMGMMARSASYWVRQEAPRCWVRGCTCARSETGREGAHHSRSRLLPRDLDQDDSSTSVTRGGLFSRDEDGSTRSTGAASSWAGVRSDDDDYEERMRFAEQYSLVPLSRRKQYSAQTFHEAVERFLRGF